MQAKPTAYSYIRFSTPEQALGDSERRQIEKAEQWAKAKKLKLDRSHTDRGKSGFKGTNRKKGSLGVFLESIAKGTIPRGSYLIVEDLDRLSREHPIDSIGLVRQIVSAGVTIVVLKNGEEYSEETLRADRSGMKMLGLVFELGRASGESARKSDLGIQNWEEKRKKAAKDGIIMTGIAPAWLTTKGTKADRKFVIIPQRAAIVRDIYNWHLQGKGTRAIAKMLNEQKVPNWGRGKAKATHWHQSYITKVLTNPAVIGEYRPHKYETVPDPENPNERIQIRVPAGEVWKGYYPPIVDLEIFQRVQALAIARGKRGVTGGKTSDEISNLFPSLVYGLLPDPMAKQPDSDEPSQPATLSIPCYYKSKGGQRGPGKYLVAETDAVNKPRRKRDEIKAERWPYLAVEFAILKTLEEINWSAVAGEGRTPEQAALAETAARLDAKSKEFEEQCRNIGKVIADTPLPTLVTQLAELEEKRKTAIENAAAARKKLTELELARGGLIKPLSIQQAAHDPKQREIRLALRAELARRIEMIQLTPKKLVAKNDRYRTTQVYSFHIMIRFVNGITRSTRVTLNKGAAPTLSSVAFQPSKNLELLPTKTTDYERAS